VLRRNRLDRDAGLRRNRLDRDAGELERRARLGADDALARDAGLGHHVDDRRRDDEHGPLRP
jgi:hypothetical protein